MDLELTGKLCGPTAPAWNPSESVSTSHSSTNWRSCGSLSSSAVSALILALNSLCFAFGTEGQVYGHETAPTGRTRRPRRRLASVDRDRAPWENAKGQAVAAFPTVDRRRLDALYRVGRPPRLLRGRDRRGRRAALSGTGRDRSRGPRAVCRKASGPPTRWPSRRPASRLRSPASSARTSRASSWPRARTCRVTTAKAKTDRLDARALARLLAQGYLNGAAF